MPTEAPTWQARNMVPRSTRDDDFIRLFLSAYEDGSWADAMFTKPDNLDRTMPAVDQLATRKSDGKTLAIEHTIIEPFIGDKEDFAAFERAFLRIENDESLVVPGRRIQVFVPVGTLQNQRREESRDAIVDSVHEWIKSNRLALRDGESQHRCAIEGVPGRPPFEISLTLKVYPLKRGSADEPGSLYVRRQQVDDNLGAVVDKALRKKLRKLVNTAADKRILLLERQHPNLYPLDMLREIEKRRSSFPDLAQVDEIWILETPFYGTAYGGSYLLFELCENSKSVRSFEFEGGKLIMKSENGVGEVIQEQGSPG
jgi:hypothetical protein